MTTSSICVAELILKFNIHSLKKTVLNPTSYDIIIGTQGVVRAQQETTPTPEGS